MHQAESLLYKLRFLLAGIVIIGFLMLTSNLVTVFGANTILDPKTSPTQSIGVNVPDTPNVVTSSSYLIADGAKRFAITLGTGFYHTCRTVSSATAGATTSLVHGSYVAVRSAGNAVSFIGRGIGSGVVGTVHAIGYGIEFVFRAPHKAVASLSNADPVSSIIRPADSKEVPIIDTKTSAAILAELNAKQQQEISQLLAAQIAANEKLGGALVAGDPNHGGYPAKWDNIAQDRVTDSWGMYNRECVSYAAWKVYQTYGTMPYWGGRGNANQWVRNARNAGIPTSTTPAVHSVAISMSGYYGHAMWVEKVSGNMIYVSQYNYDLRGHYSEMWISSNALTFIHFTR